MSAREDLIQTAWGLKIPSRDLMEALADTYRAEILREAAEEIRDHGGTRGDESFAEAAQAFADLIDPEVES